MKTLYAISKIKTKKIIGIVDSLDKAEKWLHPTEYDFNEYIVTKINPRNADIEENKTLDVSPEFCINLGRISGTLDNNFYQDSKKVEICKHIITDLIKEVYNK